jgi:hypothetical protein
MLPIIFYREITERMLEIARLEEDKKRDELSEFGFDIFFYSEEMFIPFVVIMFKDLGLLQVILFLAPLIPRLSRFLK